ncbi:hypothetical protein D3C73_1463220 [compost metagenome]
MIAAVVPPPLSVAAALAAALAAGAADEAASPELLPPLFPEPQAVSDTAIVVAAANAMIFFIFIAFTPFVF